VNITALIIDDEPIARRGISILLKDFPEIEVLGECGEGSEALEKISLLNPDLIFLDIQMPELDGFEVIASLNKKKLPAIIFTTAYDEYALKAFQVNAIDYLLKPIKKKLFKKALVNVIEIIRNRKTSLINDKILSLIKNQQKELNFVKRLTVKSRNKVIVIPIIDVLLISAEGDYVSIKTNEKAYLLRDKIGAIEKKLDPHIFCRIHRSTIVRLDVIRELEPLTNGDYVLFLENGIKLNVSRNYRKKLFVSLGKET